mmetsp:Transcript_27844/g.88498  ORF Transcript_27844/g.88498 Transcript_27844/m.88498 type:complete len:91 (+) Transcript_27844:349-621(+)
MRRKRPPTNSNAIPMQESKPERERVANSPSCTESLHGLQNLSLATFNRHCKLWWCPASAKELGAAGGESWCRAPGAALRSQRVKRGTPHV